MGGIKTLMIEEIKDMSPLSFFKTYPKVIFKNLDDSEQMEPEKKIEYIEKLIMQLPVRPVIIMDITGEDHFMVVDGAGELNALYDFFNNQFKISNRLIDEETTWLDSFYVKLPPITKRRFEHSKNFKVYRMLVEFAAVTEEEINNIISKLKI